IFKKQVLLESLCQFCENGEGNDFGHDIIPSLIRSRRTYAYDFRNECEDSPRYWRDIGTLDGYYQASMDLVRPDAPFDPYANDGWPQEPTRHPSPRRRLAASTSLYPDGDGAVRQSVLAPDIELPDDVTVCESVLLPGVRVGKGVELRRAIVEEGVHIPAGFRAGFDLNHDRHHHTVTEGGVVVVSKAAIRMEPTFIHFAARRVIAREPVTLVKT
ncbi:MAG TPA: sugar phosphate nucleotidyltransferase, partial [Terriglobia bacterium]|nr:sugar phosphate nucleotidyltransferase [Terriglobia bacterium]